MKVCGIHLCVIIDKHETVYVISISVEELHTMKVCSIYLCVIIDKHETVYVISIFVPLKDIYRH